MSKQKAFSRREVIAVACAIGLAYAIVACLWIAFSDLLLVWMFPNANMKTMVFLQTLKGWGFVIVTGMLFTFILYRKLMEIGRTQQSLQEHMESYRMLFAYNPEPMWIYDPVTLHFVEVNEAAIRTYGYTRTELLSMHVADICLPEDVQSAPLSSKTIADPRIERIERHLWKDRSVRNVSTISTNILFLGQKLCLTLANDVTEKYLAEEELRRSECKFRDVLNNSIDVIYELDSETGKYNYVSPSAVKLLLVSPDELMQYGTQRLFDRIRDDDRQLAEQHIQKLMDPAYEEQTALSVEYRLESPGEECWVRETSTVVSDRSGNTKVIVGSIRDVTAQKRNEKAISELNEELELRVQERTNQLKAMNGELEAMNSELEAFSYSVSHDLQAPLRSIGGFSKILVEDYKDRLDERGTDYLERIQSGGRRMGLLINALLDLSHVTRSALHRTNIDISSMATAIIEDLRALQPQRRVQFHTQPGILISADAGMIRIVMENLINNAWKFTAPREETRIELFSLTEDNRTVYGIRDNGVGFDMDYAGKLFTPFQRLHAANDFEGTGIGLATVRRIINRHGGKIWAVSAVDLGATFYFTLSV